MRVAIVEDESADREKIARFLRDYAAEMNILLDMEEFVSGDELMSRYKKIFDIIIFDVDMPGTNGMDTARRIREADSQVPHSQVVSGKPSGSGGNQRCAAADWRGYAAGRARL